MKILFLAPNVKIKDRTGDAVHVRELALNIAQLGNNVSLVAGYSSDQPDELKPLLNHPNINLTFNKNLFKIKFPLSKDFSTLLTCLKLAYKNPPDIIYERCFSCKMGTILSKILRKPLVVEVNGLVEEEAGLQGTLADHRFTKNIRIRLRRFFFKSSNMIVVVTSGIKEELQRKYHISPDKIAVIPNGANTELFKPMDQKSVKDELGLSHEHRYVCFVGKLAPWQGVEYLIESAPHVIKNAPKTKFLIVGDGMMYEQWKGLVDRYDLDDNFFFTGGISYHMIPKYINASDICVLPKKIIKSGYSPLKLYEYMACGKPVIATRTSGFEILEFFNAGILIDSSNPSDFSSAIIKLILNDEMREKMGRNGMKIVNEQFSWNNTAKSIIRLCKNITEEKAILYKYKKSKE